VKRLDEALSTMHVRFDLGRRVQLVSMDPYCRDITIGLYARADEHGRPLYIVHSYSELQGVRERLAFVAEAMSHLGGMQRVVSHPNQVRWGCGEAHLAATKRLFLEACKLSKPDELGDRPASMQDAKLGGAVAVIAKGGGRYEITAAANGAETEARLKAICAGYLKLAEMERWEESETGVRFACGRAHDPMMRLLLFRAMNARAALREQEMMASRGVLAAPSAQAQAP
jgi:hypothetical protein